MAYRLTEEEALLQRTVREFAETELAPLVGEAERTGVLPRARILPRMAALGLLSIGVPPDVGGVGGTTLMLCIVAEEIARVCGGFAIGVMASVLSPGILVRTGGHRAALAPLLHGAVLPAMAFTEPGAGSDLLGIRTTVTETDAGLVLTGSKTYISNGPTADVYLVAAIRSTHLARAREERARGIGLYLVPRGARGLGLGRPLGKLGMRSCETSELFFDAVVLPADAAWRTSGEHADATPTPRPAPSGFGAMMALLDVNRLYIAALSVGIAQAAFEASLAYVKERIAFDKPIGHHQATGFKVARMAVQLDAARALIGRACLQYDAGARATLAVSEAKLFASEAAVAITGDAVQIHGGLGYMEEAPVERYFRDAKVGTIWEGTTEIQQHVICRELGVLG